MADKKTDLGTLALIGLGLYFLFRKPSDGEARVEVGLTWNPESTTFEPGSWHTAHITISNPTDKGWYYAYEVYVGTDGYVRKVYLDAGQSRTDDYSFQMPMEAGTYPCYVDVRANDQPHTYFNQYPHDLGRFDFESVIIPELPPPPPGELIGNVRLLWKEPMPLAPIIPHEYTLYLTNPWTEPLDYEYEVFIGGVSQGVGEVRALSGQTWDLGGVVSGLDPGIYTVSVKFYCVTFSVDLGQFDFPSIDVSAPAVPAAGVGWTWDLAGEAASVSVLSNCYL